MPTFDFTCRNCSATFEFSRPFRSRKTPRCPACGSTKTEKRIAPPTIHFKGSGFFKTDSRPAAKKPEGKKPTTTDPVKKDIPSPANTTPPPSQQHGGVPRATGGEGA